MQHTFFIASMLFTDYGLKALEHNKAGRTTSQLGDGTIRGACSCTIILVVCFLVKKYIGLFHRRYSHVTAEKERG